MKLEFIKDSRELLEFEKTLKWEGSADHEVDEDGSKTYYAVYFQKSSGKFYKVEKLCESGIYSKPEYIAYRRNCKASEPFIINFYEVKPVEVTIVEWVDIED